MSAIYLNIISIIKIIKNKKICLNFLSKLNKNCSVNINYLRSNFFNYFLIFLILL